MSYTRKSLGARRDLSNLQPHPDSGNHTKYVKGDGTFGNPPGTGATTLADLTDVQISAPSNGDLLGYDTTVSKWKNPATVDGGNF